MDSCITFDVRPGEYALEWSCVEEVTNFFLRESLLHQKAEQDRISQLPEVVEHFRFCIRILHDVIQLSMIVEKNAYNKEGL